MRRPLRPLLLLLLPLLLLLATPAASHTCVHDAFTRNVTKVRAPPSASDGARGPRRDTVANAAPIRIVPLYRASNGGTDIATEAGMSASLKAVVEAAVAAALARFSTLLRVTPVSGNLFAYRECVLPSLHVFQWQVRGGGYGAHVLRHFARLHAGLPGVLPKVR